MENDSKTKVNIYDSSNEERTCSALYKYVPRLDNSSILYTQISVE